MTMIAAMITKPGETMIPSPPQAPPQGRHGGGRRDRPTFGCCPSRL
jgi:hypothetical protein